MALGKIFFWTEEQGLFRVTAPLVFIAMGSMMYTQEIPERANLPATARVSVLPKALHPPFVLAGHVIITAAFSLLHQVL